jgi:hypothetical protein
MVERCNDTLGRKTVSIGVLVAGPASILCRIVEKRACFGHDGDRVSADEQ